MATAYGPDAKWRWWRPESSFTQSRADIVYQFTVIGCSTETQQWSPADCTNHNLAPHHTQCALDTSLPWSVPLYSAFRFLDHVYLCWIFENFSSGVFPQFISWLSPGSRLWLEEESYICRWHFSFYFNCADKLPTHKPSSDYKTLFCCLHVVVWV